MPHFQSPGWGRLASNFFSFLYNKAVPNTSGAAALAAFACQSKRATERRSTRRRTTHPRRARSPTTATTRRRSTTTATARMSTSLNRWVIRSVSSVNALAIFPPCFQFCNQHHVHHASMRTTHTCPRHWQRLLVWRRTSMRRSVSRALVD